MLSQLREEIIVIMAYVILGASVSAILFALYQEIMNDIARAEIEDIDVTIKLAKILLHHLVLLQMLKYCVGK